MADATQRQELLELYAKLRVADVRDGLDTLGLHQIGSMSPTIRPLWRTRAFGLARTVRYVPYDGPPPPVTGEDYWAWAKQYYKDVCPYPWMDEIEEGDFIVIDQSEVDAGLMGSNNALAAVARGAAGLVTNGGVRDTDELITERVPFWSGFCSQSMVQSRLKFHAKDIEVSVGDVTVHPGDVVVGDGDGVIVVPHEHARPVAQFASAEHHRDIAARRKLYEKLGMELDETVRGPEDQT